VGNYNYGGEVEYDADKAEAIRKAFKASRYHKRGEALQTDLEHDAYWVTELGTGRQFAAVEANTRSGWDFEQISEGDD
jgi:hypothetical protein